MKSLKKIGIILILVSIFTIFFGGYLYHLRSEKIERLNIIEAKKSVKNLFINYSDKIPKDNLILQDIKQASTVTSKVKTIKVAKTLQNDLANLKNYIELDILLDDIFINNVLSSKVDSNSLQNIYGKFEKLQQNYKSLTKDKLQEIQKQYQAILDAEEVVQLLYKDADKNNVIDDVSRQQYEQAMEKVLKLPQKDIVEDLNFYLGKVLKEIERREYEIELARKIEQSYIVLNNVPYVNQVSNNVLNGCEVACLLMALQYKGYLQNVSLAQIATDIPKSDADAYSGFVGPIFEIAPNTYPHWVHPSFLATFARNYSSYSNVFDITSASSDQLKQEINNGNPVIVYVTSNFATPKNKGYEVPNNLHVMLLIGYNTMTGNYVLNDPWNKGRVVIPKATFESIYDQVGRKAVVVR